MSTVSKSIFDSDLDRDISVPRWSFHVWKDVPLTTFLQDGEGAVNFIASLAASVRDIAQLGGDCSPSLGTDEGLEWEFADGHVSVCYSASRAWDEDADAEKTTERYSVGVSDLLWAGAIGLGDRTLVSCPAPYGGYHDAFSMRVVDRDVDRATVSALALDGGWVGHLAGLPGAEEDLARLAGAGGIDAGSVACIDDDGDLEEEAGRLVKISGCGDPEALGALVALVGGDPAMNDIALAGLAGSRGVVLGFRSREARDLATTVLTRLGADVEGSTDATNAAADAPEPEAHARFSVTITDPGKHKARVVNAMREIEDIGIDEAFDLLGSCPSLFTECDWGDVAPIMKRLAEAGASLAFEQVS